MGACGLLGISVFEGGGLIDLRGAPSDKAVQVKPAKTPPNMTVEIKARHGETVFGDDVSVPIGAGFQALVLVRNIGQVEASGATIRIVLPESVRFRPGSCQTRLNSHRPLQSCEDNLVNGGLLYAKVGAGSWAQIYFDADLVEQADPGRVGKLRAIVNSNETAELSDVVRIHPFQS